MQDTNRNLGNRFQHYFFIYLIRFKLVFIAKFFLYFVVLYYSLLPTIRQRSSYYLKRRFKNSNKFTLWWHCYRLYLSFASLLLDRIIFAKDGDIEIENSQSKLEKILLENVQSDTGLIILSGHLGAWQLGLAKIDGNSRPISLVQLLSEDSNDMHYFQHSSYDKKSEVKIIPSAEGVQTSLKICAVLQNKEIVCMMGDRMVSREEKYIECQFLGEKIALPLSPFSIASITQVPIVVTFSVREKNTIKGVWAEVINVPKGIHKSSELLMPYVQRYVAALEYMTEHYPYQFYNFYNMWEKK